MLKEFVKLSVELREKELGRPLTRREKVRFGKAKRVDWFANPVVPEAEKQLEREHSAAKRAKRRVRPRKVNTNSRSYRWSAAVGAARAAIDKLEEAKSDFESAWGEVLGVRQEFQDWYDNLTEGLQQGPTGQKLDELLNTIDDGTPEDLEEMMEAVDNAEGVDLPMGWGRD